MIRKHNTTVFQLILPLNKDGIGPRVKITMTKFQQNYEVKAALVISAHWCTRGTFVNISPEQKQIYDYYGFPKHYYDPKYNAKGAPEIGW